MPNHERVELLWDRPNALRQSILLDSHAPSIKSRKIAVRAKAVTQMFQNNVCGYVTHIRIMRARSRAHNG